MEITLGEAHDIRRFTILTDPRRAKHIQHTVGHLVRDQERGLNQGGGVLLEREHPEKVPLLQCEGWKVSGKYIGKRQEGI